MTSILIRTLIIYILLTFSLRIMGKRQLGELDVSELVSTLLISEIAAIPIDDPDIPLLNAVIPILFILSAEVILSTVKNKNEKIKTLIEGKPDYIIYKGRLLQKNLSDNRISINEFLSEMRTQGIADISDIDYAIVEKGGALSIIKKGEAHFAHPVIIDGKILTESLKGLGFDENWLKKRLKERNIQAKDVFLFTVNDIDETSVIMKEKKL